jgi:hypothetical protein
VAAHCFWEGLTDEGWRLLHAVWDRYDGRRRNPFNEIECGDHYARAMAGWSALEALAGLRHDAPAASLRLRATSLRGARLPVLLSAGWGLAAADAETVTLECRGGSIALRTLGLDGAAPETAAVDGVAVDARADGDTIAICGGIILRPGQVLTVRLTSAE